MFKTTYRLLIGILVLAFFVVPVSSEERVALVIGNSNYDNVPLRNPVNDADLMTKTLINVGFKVTKVIDANRRVMKRALIDHSRRLRESDAVGLVYYAGHGVQINGENYLIPVKANLEDESEVPIEGINVNEFLLTTRRTANHLSIIILDACRDNPFGGSFRSSVNGMAEVSAPSGTFVAYAAAPGQLALDGKGKNSPYVTALANAMVQPGLTIEQVFKQTRRDVLAVTNNKQTPWDNSSIVREFFFNTGLDPEAEKLAQKTVTDAPPIDDHSVLELEYWNMIKNENDPSLIKSFIEQFPRGLLADLARKKLKDFDKPKVSTKQRVSSQGKTKRPAQDALIPASQVANKLAKTDQSKTAPPQDDTAARPPEPDEKAEELTKKPAQKTQSEPDQMIKKTGTFNLVDTDARNDKKPTLKPKLEVATPKESEIKENLSAALQSGKPPKPPRALTEPVKQKTVLTPVTTPKPVAQPAPNKPNRKEIARQAQGQLKRLGCYAGRVDGAWGRLSQAAMRKYNRLATSSLSVAVPMDADIAILVQRPGRYCIEQAKSESAPKTHQPVRLAALPKPEQGPQPPSGRSARAAVLQLELKRLGCYVEKINGVWDQHSRLALAKYNKLANTKFDTIVPGDRAQAALKQTRSGYCRTGGPIAAPRYQKPNLNVKPQGLSDRDKRFLCLGVGGHRGGGSDLPECNY